MAANLATVNTWKTLKRETKRWQKGWYPLAWWQGIGIGIAFLQWSNGSFSSPQGKRSSSIWQNALLPFSFSVYHVFGETLDFYFFAFLPYLGHLHTLNNSKTSLEWQGWKIQRRVSKSKPALSALHVLEKIRKYLSQGGIYSIGADCVGFHPNAPRCKSHNLYSCSFQPIPHWGVCKATRARNPCQVKHHQGFRSKE